MPDAVRSFDPFAVFLRDQLTHASRQPIPLVAIDIDVELAGGLARVTTRRRFRNAEDRHIEAALTFPVPVQATLFELKAMVEDRTLVARAEAKTKARETYEGAIQDGKSAVLHEELLKGIHMLSVANLAPGASVEVFVSWAMPLTVVNGEGHLRIPMTAGDVYGTSSFADADELVTGGAVLTGTLTIRSADGAVALAGGVLNGGKASFMTDRPVDLVLRDWKPATLRGRTADGHGVALTLTPAAGPAATALDLAVLVDHSGSMSSPTGTPEGVSKHLAVVRALEGLADRLGPDDQVDLWEFSSDVRHVGHTDSAGSVLDRIVTPSKPKAMRRLVKQLSTPTGGTEIGLGLHEMLNASRARTVLLITDGRSHALDVQALARRGRPVFVVLVGEDSLEANVGHLAALTGGQIFVCGGAELGQVVQAACDAAQEFENGDDASTAGTSVRRSGQMIDIRYGADDPPPQASTMARAVATTAAAIRLGRLDDEAALALALAEGLVSHLTSLVLVDEASGGGSDTPVFRKVVLSEPRTRSRGVHPALHQRSELSPGVMPPASGERPAFASLGRSRVILGYRSLREDTRLPLGMASLRQLAQGIDWAGGATSLAAGDLSALPVVLSDTIRRIASQAELIAAAAKAGLDPIVLVIGLLADLAAQQGNRHAARIARKILGNWPSEENRRLLYKFAAE